MDVTTELVHGRYYRVGTWTLLQSWYIDVTNEHYIRTSVFDAYHNKINSIQCPLILRPHSHEISKTLSIRAHQVALMLLHRLVAGVHVQVSPWASPRAHVEHTAAGLPDVKCSTASLVPIELGVVWCGGGCGSGCGLKVGVIVSATVGVVMGVVVGVV